MHAIAAALCLLAAPPPDGEWPQFRGPGRDGVYDGPRIEWGKDGPRRVWERKVGAGFSAPVISGGRLLLFHRVMDMEVLEAMDSGTGKPIWSDREPASYHDDFGFDEGPRGTPAIASGRAFAFGADGFLRAVDAETGKRLWSCDTRARFSVRKGFFGAACSPLVDGDRVLVEVGGRTDKGGAGAVCFDAATGNVLWTAADDEASYASPVAATFGGKHQAVFFSRSGLLSVAIDDGEILLRFPWRSRNRSSVNAATPIVAGERIFLSSSYDTGAVLLDVKGKEPKVVWSGDESLSNHYATSVLRDGTLYGFHGRQEYGIELRAVDLETGKVLWSEKGPGAGTVSVAGKNLLVVSESGELILAPASPRGFSPVARAKAIGGTVRAYPALAGGRIYLRNEDTLVCLEGVAVPQVEPGKGPSGEGAGGGAGEGRKR